MRKTLLLLALSFTPAFAQVSTSSIVAVSTAPSGACTAFVPLKLKTPDGTLWSCQNGTYAQVGGSGGVPGFTFTPNATGFSIAAGTTSKTLTVSNTMTLSGSGVDGNTYSMPSVSASIAATNRSNNFTAAQTFNANMFTAVNIRINGTAFTATGCGTPTLLVGGSTAGQFVANSATCSAVVTMGAASATNGWTCWANDLTTSTAFRQSASTTTTATLTGTPTLGDTINFGCIGY